LTESLPESNVELIQPVSRIQYIIHEQDPLRLLEERKLRCVETAVEPEIVVNNYRYSPMDGGRNASHLSPGVMVWRYNDFDAPDFVQSLLKSPQERFVCQ
jgi:hypothetical protein